MSVKVTTEYGTPIMDSLDLAVIEAAEAYMDQLCGFNDLLHPEVVKQRAILASAVDDRHHKFDQEMAT
jgi:hypothetical protein